MTEEDVKEMLSVLKAAYPHSFQNLTRRDANAMIKLWARQFKADDVQLVSAVIDSLIATRETGYTPTVGEIKNQLYRIQTADGLNDGQAWNLVEKACRRGLYHAQEEFDKLPPDVQTAVGGPEQLKAWAQMDAETVNSVVASNFRRTYRTVQERAKEKALMPPEVREVIAGISEKMMLGSRPAYMSEYLGEPREPAALPASLKPMAYRPQETPKPEPIMPPKYEPLPADEWEQKREEMLRKLEGKK